MADDERLSGSARRAAIAALAAELGHDLQGPLNLFRLAADRAAGGQPLDAEDASLLREELERLSALGARLRELARQPLVRAPWPARALVERALAGSARAAAELELDLGPEHAPSISCDRDLLSLALAELIDNALAARRRRAGVRFVAGEEPGFCVWDDGRGFAPGDGSAALAWGVSSRPGAAGLGLTVVLRAARAHGFKLRLGRAAERTEVWLSIPPRELREPTRLPP